MRLDHAVAFVMERLPRPLEHPFADDCTDGLAAVLGDGRAEIVDGWIVKAGEMPPLPATAPTTKVARRTPRPKVPVDGCVDQRSHLDAIWSSTKLKETSSGLLCALALQRAYGRKLKTDGYGQVLKHAVDLIAEDAGVARTTAARAMREVVEVGLFERADLGFGRKGGGGVASWRATLPCWYRA